MAHPKFSIGSVKLFNKNEEGCNEDEGEQSTVNEEGEADEDEPIETHRVMLVKGEKSGVIDDDKGVELDELWNEVADRAKESSVKKSNETQFIMIGDVLSVITSTKKVLDN